MKSTSLIRRTIAVVLLAELLCAIAFSLTALEHERRTRYLALDIQLQGRSDSLLGAIQDAEDPDDNVAIDPEALRVSPSDVYAVYNFGGKLIGSSPDAPPVLIAPQGTGFSDRSVGARHYRVLERSATRIIDRDETSGATVRQVTILYASSKEHIWHEVKEAARFYAMVSLVCLLLTAALLILLLRRVLAPLQELASATRTVTARDPHFEPPPSALRVRELQPLSQTLQTAIAALRHALENEQRFVGDAAHELKTAVAVVRSTIQVLMMKPRSAKDYVDGLETLLTDNQRVEDLVARMLLLARMDETHNPEPAQTNLGEVINTLAPRLRSFAEVRGVTIVAHQGELAIVGLSVEKAEVLLSNLVINAVQHSRHGSSVEIRQTTAGDAVTLAVQDWGTGIAAEALPHVFERFFREDRSRSRETGGAGLGLAICKSIVDAAGGTISVESMEGHGTTVSVTLQSFRTTKRLR